MKKYPNTKINVNKVKKLLIFTELLALFLVISSSIAIAYAGFPEDLHQKILNLPNIKIINLSIKQLTHLLVTHLASHPYL